MTGTRILNTSSLSSSKQNDIARTLSESEEAMKLTKTFNQKQLQFSVTCCYDIRNGDSVLDIETMSESGSDEKKVLILPLSAFEVKESKKDTSDFVESVLEEVLEENFTFSSSFFIHQR